jgi:hypothetical protein
MSSSEVMTGIQPEAAVAVMHFYFTTIVFRCRGEANKGGWGKRHVLWDWLSMRAHGERSVRRR